MHLNNPENQRIQQEYRAMPPCTSANTFVLCVRGKRKWMRAGCWGFWACVILLTRIQIHRRRALSPQSAHHIKAPGFAGLQTERFFFFFFPPSFVFLPLGEDRFSTLVRSTQKSLPLSQPWSTITVSLPSERSLTAGQKASQNSQRVLVQTTGRLAVPAYTNSL